MSHGQSSDSIVTMGCDRIGILSAVLSSEDDSVLDYLKSKLVLIHSVLMVEDYMQKSDRYVIRWIDQYTYPIWCIE